MYTYPPEEIERLKETLRERAFANSIPKKYSVPMFEAYEAIVQLQKGLKGKETSTDDHLVAANKMVCENQPLTLEELRKMDGEPVWIEDWWQDFHGWELSADAEDYCAERDTQQYGTLWLAYRRKPEEE